MVLVRCEGIFGGDDGPMSQPARSSESKMSSRDELPRLRVISPGVETVETEAGIQWTPELGEEIVRRSAELETATPQEILKWATDRFAPHFTMATAFGPEGMTIIHMLAEIAPETPIFNLDTGYQFEETLELREQVKAKYGIAVEYKRPELTVEQYEQLHGGPLYKTNPSQCCGDRKLKVLVAAVKGMHAWASAIRRDQSPDRAQAAIVGWDKKFQLVKISPLANSTKSDIWKMITDHDIPYNPLHDKGYTSVGCWPCTRAVQVGEDDRAGRWSGTAKTECGLHSMDNDNNNDNDNDNDNNNDNDGAKAGVPA
jgi:phosphoadenosine phosphosulfate reductase